MGPRHALSEEKEKRQLLAELGLEVIFNARNELFLALRYLDAALSALRPVARADINPCGTDGRNLFFSPEGVIALFKTDRRICNRTYLHLLFHCLFNHLEGVHSPGETRLLGGEASKEEVRLWNLCSDITAEFLVDELYLPCVHKSKSALRLSLYQILRRELMVVTVQGVYDLFARGLLPGKEDLSALEAEFYMDDHKAWGSLTREQRQEVSRQWKDIRERMQTEMESFSVEAGGEQGALYETLAAENYSGYDYRTFLRKFCVLREEPMLDMDTFDYIYYHYGLSLYGNVPLIEPLETKEVKRIEEFVIVVDTSMSCKKELISRFLEETYEILTGFQSFSRRICVHLIQCDDQVRRDTVITDLEGLRGYMDHFEVAGRGGTDFRPAFAYVEELRSQGQLRSLRGLLYFTDGFGTYPVKKPSYDTAFLFVRGQAYSDVDVPPWAMKLILPKAEIEKMPGAKEALPGLEGNR